MVTLLSVLLRLFHLGAQSLWVDEMLTVGRGVPVSSVTVTESAAVPPGPLHVREYVLSRSIGPTCWLPDVALDPDHAPELQEVKARYQLDAPFVLVVGRLEQRI